MSKLLTLTAAIALLGSSAIAGPLFGLLPDHEPNGYRDTGCDAAAQTAVPGTNYFNNPTCPGASSSASFAFPATPEAEATEETGGDDTAS